MAPSSNIINRLFNRGYREVQPSDDVLEDESNTTVEKSEIKFYVRQIRHSRPRNVVDGSGRRYETCSVEDNGPNRIVSRTV